MLLLQLNELMAEFLRIGDLELRNRVITAPMAGVTDMAFRYICHGHGAGLTVTEMTSSKGLIQNNKKTHSLIRAHPEARPYAVQLFGGLESDMARAARIAQDSGADAVDLNLGCPVRKILRGGSGGALLKDLKRAGSIVAAMRRELSIPLTVKMRAGYSKDMPVAVKLARLVIDEGADAVAVHPRFVNEGFADKARWEIIGEVASAVDAPVIGNGDISSAEHASRMIRRTGCAAVMVGRAAIGNPFIFREIAAALDGQLTPPPPTIKEKLQVALEHLDVMLEYLPLKYAVWQWRKHLCWYARGMPHASDLRRAVFSIEDPEKLRLLARQFFLEEHIPAGAYL